MTGTCPLCGCPAETGRASHAQLAALLADDLDAALESGLLTTDGCHHCSPTCTATLATAREARQAALAARERFRQRAARLARRRDARLGGVRPPTAAPATQGTPGILPTAAADALARALARARDRRR